MLSKRIQNMVIKAILDSYIKKSEQTLKTQGHATNKDFIESLMFLYYDSCDIITNLTRHEILSDDLSYLAHSSLLAHRDVIFDQIYR